MDNRNGLQKNEAKFPAAFFLFRHGERHKNAGLVYAHRPLVAQRNPVTIQEQESILNGSGIHTDTPDQPFRHDVDSSRGQAHLHQAHGKPQQKPCNCTNVPLLKGGRIFKTKKPICK